MCGYGDAVAVSWSDDHEMSYFASTQKIYCGRNHLWTAGVLLLQLSMFCFTGSCYCLHSTGTLVLDLNATERQMEQYLRVQKANISKCGTFSGLWIPPYLATKD